MLKAILHQAVAVPQVYDLIQNLAGAGRIAARLAPRLLRTAPKAVIVDVGGGTGAFRHLCPFESTYLCLDIDRAKLRGHVRKHRKGGAILSDATRAPIQSESADLVLCTFVSHHLREEELTQVISESRRILKRTGTYIFMDAIWQPARWLGRLLWKFDRGANPRSAEALQSAISHHFTLTETERFAIYHEYVLYVGAKR